MLGGESIGLDSSGRATVPLAGYGFEWLRAVGPDEGLQY
jgi:hypothetical protein